MNFRQFTWATLGTFFILLGLLSTVSFASNPPLKPVNVKIDEYGGSQVKLSWEKDPAEPDGHILGVYIYRDGVKIFEEYGLDSTLPYQYTDSTVNRDTSYSYSVSFVDGELKESPKSGVVVHTSCLSMNVSELDVSSVSVTFECFTSFYNNIKFELYRNGTLIHTVDPAQRNITYNYNDNGLLPNRPYTYELKATLDGSSATESTTTAITGYQHMIIPDTITFPPATIGVDREIKMPFDGLFSVGDTTGNTNGWRVTLSASPFLNLAHPSIKYPGCSILFNYGSVATELLGKPSPEGTPPTSPDHQLCVTSVGGSGITILTAAPGTGQSGYDIDFGSDAFILRIPIRHQYMMPGETSASFRMTLTWNFVIGP